MNSTSHRYARFRYLAAAVVACAALATAGTATAAAARPASRSVPRAVAGGTSASDTSVHTIHLVLHETQNKLIDEGGFGDEVIVLGILDNAVDTTQVGIFAGTLTSVTSDRPPLTLATADLQLQGGQIAVQGFFDAKQSSGVHAVTGGTGIYRGVRGEFFYTEIARGVLDLTLTLLPAGEE
jgi:hypothetical protein